MYRGLSTTLCKSAEAIRDAERVNDALRSIVDLQREWGGVVSLACVHDGDVDGA